MSDPLRTAQWEYPIDLLRESIRSGKVSEPFKHFVGKFHVFGELVSVTATGFHNFTIKGPNEDRDNYKVTAEAIREEGISVEDMLIPPHGGGLLVRFEYRHREQSNPTTVKVKVYDAQERFHKWEKGRNEP